MSFGYAECVSFSRESGEEDGNCYCGFCTECFAIELGLKRLYRFSEFPSNLGITIHHCIAQSAVRLVHETIERRVRWLGY